MTNDAALIARKRGWTLEATRNRLRFQDAFNDLVPKIATKYPHAYAGASMAPAAGHRSRSFRRRCARTRGSP